MTIYTSKFTDENKEAVKGDDLPDPLVFTGIIIDDDKAQNEEKYLDLPPAYPGVAVRKKKQSLPCCLRIFLVAGLAIVSILAGIVVIHYTQASQRRFRGRCGVTYHEFRGGQPQQGPTAEAQGGWQLVDHTNTEEVLKSLYGHFTEDIDIDEQNNLERIMTPDVGSFSAAAIMHDFANHLTVIKHQSERNCFILPLEDKEVMPPTKVIRHLSQQTDPTVVLFVTSLFRRNYTVPQSEAVDLSSFGPEIQDHCEDHTAYMAQMVPLDAVMTSWSPISEEQIMTSFLMGLPDPTQERMLTVQLFR